MCALFSGHIVGTPIIIDKFLAPTCLPTEPLHFILTHAHSDHMVGLSDTFRRGPIYCSHITRALTLTLFPALSTVVTPLPLDVPHHISAATSITLVDANHCAGSVTAIIRHCGNVIYYTGDTRYDPLHFTQSAVHSAVGAVQRLYIDTTFASTLTAHFPTSARAIQAAINLISNYLVSFPPLARGQHTTSSSRVYINGDMLGTEPLLHSLSVHFHMPLYISDQEMGDGGLRRRQLGVVGAIADRITTEFASTCLHLSATKGFQSFAQSDHHRRQKLVDVSGGHTTSPALYVKPSTMWFVCNRSQSTNTSMHVSSSSSVSLASTRIDMSVPQQDDYGVYHILWSMHSDCCELMEYIAFLQPNFVIPINTPVHTVGVNDDNGGLDTLAGTGIRRRSLLEVEAIVVRRLAAMIKSLMPENANIKVIGPSALAATASDVPASSTPTTFIVPNAPRPRADNALQTRSISSPVKMQQESTAPTATTTRPNSRRELFAPSNAAALLMPPPLPVAARTAQAATEVPVTAARTVSMPAPEVSPLLPTREVVENTRPEPDPFIVLPISHPQPSRPVFAPLRPPSYYGCAVTPLTVHHFDFRKFTRSVVWIERDIRGEQRILVRNVVRSLGAECAEHLSSRVDLIIMRGDRRSSQILFAQIIRSTCRARRRLGAAAMLPMYIYDVRCLAVMQRLTINISSGPAATTDNSDTNTQTLAASDSDWRSLDQYYVWSTFELSDAKVNEVMNAHAPLLQVNNEI